VYIICFASLINSFKVAFVYYLKYTVGIKEVDGSKYNCGCRLRIGCAQVARRLRIGCAQAACQKNTI